jgi:hypothetical protein
MHALMYAICHEAHVFVSFHPKTAREGFKVCLSMSQLLNDFLSCPRR